MDYRLLVLMAVQEQVAVVVVMVVVVVVEIDIPPGVARGLIKSLCVPVIIFQYTVTPFSIAHFLTF